MQAWAVVISDVGNGHILAWGEKLTILSSSFKWTEGFSKWQVFLLALSGKILSVLIILMDV